jgi:DNA polymerase-4
MNAFFAAVEQRFNPGLRGKPIVVCGNPKSRTVVAACSYEAKAFGVKNGMSVAEARRLCPRAMLIGGNPDKYVDVSRHIFAILMELTPEVEIFSIDEAFMDVTGTYRFFGQSPEALAHLIKRRIREAYGLTCSIGIAPNKLLAKLASDMQKPDGLVRIRPDEIAACMEKLPIESLCGIGLGLTEILNGMGILTCADLGQVPEDRLVKRFGVIGRSLKRMGQGIDASPVMPYSAAADAKSMGHMYTLPRDTEQESEIFGTLLRLCEQVARRLRADGSQGKTVGLTIRYSDFATVTHHRTLRFATDTGPRIYRVALGLFERYCRPLCRRVRLVGVGVSQLSRSQRQESFLCEDAFWERLDGCMDRVNDRFGEFTIVRASALAPLVPKAHGFLKD